MNTAPAVEPKPRRTPLGQRGKDAIDQTLLRVVGKAKAPVLEVAAFQSFAE